MSLQKYLKKFKTCCRIQEILTLFSYDVANDCEELHPTKICNTCRRRLQDLKGRQIVNTQTIAVFLPHDENCKLCLTKRGYSKHVFAVNLLRKENENSFQKPFKNIEQIKQVAISHEFDIIKENSEGTIFSCCEEIKDYIFINKSVKVFEDFSWRIFCYGRKVPSYSKVILSLPNIINRNNIEEVFTTLQSAKICFGNDDFPDLIKKKLDQGAELSFLDVNHNVKAVIETLNFQRFQKYSTIRTVNCEVLFQGKSKRCSACQEHRAVLNSASYRLSRDDPNVVKKNTAKIYLSRNQIGIKLTAYQKERRSLIDNRARLEKNIRQLVKKEGIKLENETQKIVTEVLEKNDSGFDENSTQNLLWEQQKKINNLKKKSSMRWHPVIVRWCLSIYLRSPGEVHF